MPIDTGTPQGGAFARMLKKLGDRQRRYQELQDRYDNLWGIPVGADRNVAAAYRRLMVFARTNFAELVVEAVRERMRPVGFRTGADGDDTGDKEAWRIWQANSLDADSMLVHRPGLVMGDAYAIVGPVDDDTGAPVITPEDPREVVTEHDPVRKRKTTAALKVFYDADAGYDRGYLYLPGEIHRLRRTRSARSVFTWTARAWEWDYEDGEPVATLDGVVPVVRFANRANILGQPTGEFEAHCSILDRINYTVLNRVEIATLQAFRQRAVKGLPATDEAGVEIDYRDVFRSDPGALWQLPETAEMWESGEVNLDPIRNAVRDDIQDLAAVTRTPLFYLTPEAANGSAEGASLAREGLVFKTEDRLVEYGESWEQVMALAFAMTGDDQRASRADMEIMWASAERFSLAERFDAAVKAKAADVPWRTIMLDVLGYSPQQVDRMEADRDADALRLAALAPQPPAPAPPAPPTTVNVNGNTAPVATP
jgi:hypothetical protein